jgi:hypothetical protein
MLLVIFSQVTGTRYCTLKKKRYKFSSNSLGSSYYVTIKDAKISINSDFIIEKLKLMFCIMVNFKCSGQVETDNCCVSPVALEPDNIETIFPSHPPGPPTSSAGLHGPLSVASFTSPPASPLRHSRASPPPPALTTRDPNWQSSKCSVRERNAAMFNNSLMADIYFLVGQPTDIKRLVRKIWVKLK